MTFCVSFAGQLDRWKNKTHFRLGRVVCIYTQRERCVTLRMFPTSFDALSLSRFYDIIVGYLFFVSNVAVRNR